MSDALLHASEPGSPRRQENVASSRRRGRRRGVEIRPGSAKQARLESGLRLGHPVRARSHASAARAYFEQAKDVLMAAEAMGNEAGAASIMQDPGALNLAEEALAACRSLNPVPTTTEARLLFILGVAHGQRHDYSNSIAALEESVAIGTSIQDLRQLSMVYGNLSLSYQELGQLAQAARYAHRAMAIYETLRDKRMIAISENNLAILLFVQGDL